MTGRGAFSTRNGPYYTRRVEEGVEQAFFADDHHCNGYGIVHGGMLAAFLDGLLAHGAHRGQKRQLVTIQLSINYLSAARKGQWVIGSARQTRVAKDVIFVEGVLAADGRDVVRASGVFKAVDKPVTP
jgi:uncharacterized protein (TIGR00369 family)